MGSGWPHLRVPVSICKAGRSRSRKWYPWGVAPRPLLPGPAGSPSRPTFRALTSGSGSGSFYVPQALPTPPSRPLGVGPPLGPSGEAMGHFRRNLGVQGVRMDASQERSDWGWLREPPSAPTHHPAATSWVPPEVGSIPLTWSGTVGSRGFVRINISQSPWLRVLIRPRLLRHTWNCVHLYPREQGDGCPVGHRLPGGLPPRVCGGH